GQGRLESVHPARVRQRVERQPCAERFFGQRRVLARAGVIRRGDHEGQKVVDRVPSVQRAGRGLQRAQQKQRNLRLGRAIRQERDTAQPHRAPEVTLQRLVARVVTARLVLAEVFLVAGQKRNRGSPFTSERQRRDEFRFGGQLRTDDRSRLARRV